MFPLLLCLAISFGCVTGLVLLLPSKCERQIGATISICEEERERRAQVAALVHEYEATSALRELSLQADVARPAARSCRADLGRLLESRLCADVTLAYRGTGFPAHRAILSARCPFFRDLLSAPRQQMVRFSGTIELACFVAVISDVQRGIANGEKKRVWSG